MEALVFDCDGVIVESEDLHREAYNAAFKHFGLKIDNRDVSWSEEYYDMLQNKVGGGKPKMRYHFGEHGWPSSNFLPHVPSEEGEQTSLIDALQDWKSDKYRDLIASDSVHARPGVMELLDEARAEGLKLAVCSAATKSSVAFCIKNLLGEQRYEALDCFLAGDDIPAKKPDPSIYKIASERLGVKPENCLVVEDSKIGLQAALGAGMPCLITYTRSTKSEDFQGAVRIVESLAKVKLADLQSNDSVKDDR